MVIVSRVTVSLRTKLRSLRNSMRRIWINIKWLRFSWSVWNWNLRRKVYRGEDCTTNSRTPKGPFASTVEYVLVWVPSNIRVCLWGRCRIGYLLINRNVTNSIRYFTVSVILKRGCLRMWRGWCRVRSMGLIFRFLCMGKLEVVKLIRCMGLLTILVLYRECLKRYLELWRVSWILWVYRLKLRWLRFIMISSMIWFVRKNLRVVLFSLKRMNKEKFTCLIQSVWEWILCMIYRRFTRRR